MARNMFSHGEEEVLNKLPYAINNVKKKLDLDNMLADKMDNNYNDILPFSQMNTGSGEANSKSYVRVLTNNESGRFSDNSNVSYPVENNFNHYNVGDTTNIGISNNNSASSFVLILAALVALVLIIFVVTTGILNIIGY